MTEDANGARLMKALTELGDLTTEIPPDEGLELLDTTTKEVFFREWPTIEDWAQALWQRLNGELGKPSLPEVHPESPDSGGGGGGD